VAMRRGFLLGKFLLPHADHVAMCQKDISG
jgi:nicotinamide mononucleotide adenylyltransferase